MMRFNLIASCSSGQCIDRSFSFGEIKKNFTPEPRVLGRHVTGGRKKEIIFEYQMVAGTFKPIHRTPAFSKWPP